MIVRAQNQASAALRRVAGDVRSLSRIQELGLRRNRLAIQQGNIMRQQRRALNELESVTSGQRFLQAQRARQSILDRELRTQNALKTNLEAQRIAAQRLVAAETAGMKKRSLGYRQLQLNARRLVDQEASLRAGLRNIGPALQVWEQRMVGLKQRASVLNSELATLDQRLGNLRAQQMALNKEISAARWERFGVASRTVAHLGRVMQLTGLVGGAAIGFAADAAAKFQTQVALVATQTGRAGSGIQSVTRNSEALTNILLRQLPKSIATTEDLTQSTYDLFSSVDSARKSYLSLADGEKLLSLANKAAIAGQTDLSTAVESLIRPMNTFGFTARQMPNVLNRMFAAVRFGQLTFQEFATSLQTTAPAAKAANQNFDTLSGTMAFLSRRLGPTKAAIGFARLTEIFGREKFISGLKKFNVNIKDSEGRLLQMPQIIDKLVTRFPKLAKGGTFLQQFIRDMSGTEGTIQARRAFVFLAQQLGQYREMVNRVSKDNVEFDRSFKALNRTAGVRWAKFLNQLRALMLQFGAAAIPTLLEILKPIQRLVDWFGSLDEATRRSIGKWAVYGATILLVGGTIAAIVGTIGSAISALGALGILFPTVIAVALAFAAAARAIQGDWSGVGDLISEVFDKITSSGTAMAIAAGVIALSIYKIVRAILALRTAMAAASVVGGMGGARGATGLLAGLFTAVGVAPGIGILAAAVGGLGLAMYAYSQHAKDAAETSEEMARAQQHLQAALLKPGQIAATIGDIPEALTGVRRAQLDLRELNNRIDDFRKQLKDAAGDEKEQIKIDLHRAILDRADAYDVLAESAKKANEDIRGVNKFMAAQAVLFTKMQRKQQALQALQRLARPGGTVAATSGAGFGLPTVQNIDQVENQITRLKNDLGSLNQASRNASAAFLENFTKMVHGLQKQGELPKGITDKMIGEIAKLTAKVGTMPGLKALRLLFKAELDPESFRKLPGQIKSFIRGQRLDQQKVKIQGDLSFAGGLREHIAQMTGRAPQKIKVDADTGAARRQVDILKQWIGGQTLPKIKMAGVTPAPAALGSQIISGMVAGVNASSPALSSAVVAAVNNAIEAGKAAAKTHSPSKRTRDEIGKPLMQGVIVGIISEFGNLKRSAYDSAKEWQEAWQESFQDAKKTAIDFMKGYYDDIRSSLEQTFFGQPLGDLNQIRQDFGVALDVGDLTADLRKQTRELRNYQKEWNKLLRRGVPLQLLTQLQAMGEDGEAIIAALSGASGKELKKYVKAWKNAQKLLNDIAKQQLKQQIKEWNKLGKSFALGIMLGIRDQKPALMRFFKNLFEDAVRSGRHHHRRDDNRRPAIGAARLAGDGFGSVSRVSPVTMIVNAHHTETLDTTLKRATFRIKHRRRRG